MPAVSKDKRIMLHKCRLINAVLKNYNGDRQDRIKVDFHLIIEFSFKMNETLIPTMDKSRRRNCLVSMSIGYDFLVGDKGYAMHSMEIKEEIDKEFVT